MLKHLSFTFVVLFASGHAHSAWVVQVGAFANDPPAAFVAEADRHGPAYKQYRSDGTIAVNVGPWQVREEAEVALVEIRNSYPDAFIKRYRPSSRTAGTTSRGVSTSREPRMPDDLTDRERRNVVLLDGALHFKNGDEFVPIEEYMRRR